MPGERQSGPQVEPFVLGGKEVSFTHLDRVYFPATGYTKAEVLDYYLQIAPYLLPHVKDRPLTLERYPEGVQNGSFFQKNASSYFPPWLRTYPVERKDREKVVHFPLVDDEADLLYLVNQGTITFHTQMARTVDPIHPDVMVLDIDPPEIDGPEGAAGDRRTQRSAQFKSATDVAVLLRQQLRDAGFDPVVKTSGKRGLHLAFHLDGQMDYTEARAQLGRLFAELAERHSDLLTTLIRKNKREGRVYLDALRMSPGDTIVPPYVVRPTAEATVSMPVTWEELDSLQDGRAFTIKTAPARLEKIGDLWAGLTGAERSAG
jgi:bifunctional non-homologous end joining protein LigD